MPKSLREGIEEIRRLARVVQQDLAAAGDSVSRINFVIDELATNGSVAPIMLLGDVVYDSRNNRSGSQGRPGRLLQAAIGVGHGGVGVIVWDVIRYSQFVEQSHAHIDEFGVILATYDECPSEVKHLVLPYLASLFDRLYELVPG